MRRMHESTYVVLAQYARAAFGISGFASLSVEVNNRFLRGPPNAYNCHRTDHWPHRPQGCT